MKILITGGTGFTGSHLVKHVLREGNKAVVLDNQEGIMLDELKKLGGVAGRSAALGYDGKWVLHPDQIAAGTLKLLFFFFFFHPFIIPS